MLSNDVQSVILRHVIKEKFLLIKILSVKFTKFSFFIVICNSESNFLVVKYT